MPDISRGFTDQHIIMDLMNSAKQGIRSYAWAISETATPELRNVLTQQLADAIRMHEEVTNFAMMKGLYHAYNTQEQIQMDMQNVQQVLNMPSQ
ncbi:MAG: spore coat protein [Chitinophagales bacterium]